METVYREQYIRFGLKVQYYRKLQGLTQEAFAEEWAVMVFRCKDRKPHAGVWRFVGNAV